MIGTIIRKEIVSHVLSLRFGTTFILFLLLVFASFYVTVRQFQHDQYQFVAAQRSAAGRMDEIMKETDGGERLDHLNWAGRIDPVGVPQLSCVVQGLWPSMPVALNTGREMRNIGRSDGANPLLGLMRLPDLVYVVSVVLSLLAVLFAFDSVSGEKEAGTLRLMLSNALPRHSVLLGKWIGGYVALLSPFLIAAAGGLVYAWWAGALQPSSEIMVRLGLLVALACLYISIFFTLSLFISSLTHRSTTSLFLCLLIWVVWILVVPNLAPVVAKIASPTPSAEKIAAEKLAVDKEIKLRISRLTVTSGELEYSLEIEKKREQLRQEGVHRMELWDRFLEDATQRQTTIAQTLGRLSPSACWTYSAASIANTGCETYACLLRDQQKLGKEINDLSKRLIQERRRTGKWRMLTANDIPCLQALYPDLGQAAQGALNDILVLVILNVVFFMAGFVAFLRYDVR